MSAPEALRSDPVAWSDVMMNNYGTPPLTLTHGSGAVVIDDQGAEYLDLLAGIAVNALGHAHPAVVEAVSDQVRTLGHVSNLAAHPRGLELAETLLSLTGREDGRVFFANSGAEANEAAFKISRLTGRGAVVALDGGFHGRTFGALSLTGQPTKRAPFEPLVPGVRHVPLNDVAALKEAVTDEVAMVLIEPIQGEAGVRPATPEYLEQARASTSDAGALLAFDEVQTGIGRTGTWFGYQSAGCQRDVTPDVITLAKGLGGGLPIGAVIAFGEAGTLLTPGTHGSTFGGNPIAAAAALAVIRTITEEGLLQAAIDREAQIRSGFQDASVAGIRGRGLLLAVELKAPIAADVEALARHGGVLVNAVAPDAIRLAPPLTITEAQLASAIEVLGEAIDTASTAHAQKVES